MKKIMLPALLLLAFVVPPDTGAQDKCGAAKLKAAGKKAYGKAEIIVAKQRHGPINNVMLRFDGDTTKFSNFVADDHLPERTV